MPFGEPSMANRRDSWPPTVVRLNGADLSCLDDIDSNPISYFLTTPEIDDDDDVEYFSAGIESDEDKLHEIRDVSPSSLQSDNSDSNDDPSAPEDTSEDLETFLSLNDFTDAHVSDAGRRALRKETETEEHRAWIAVRGRATVRHLTTKPRRARGHTRSVSAPTLHSWREPSTDVWSIPEEKEDVVEDVKPVADWEKYQGNLEGKLEESPDDTQPQKKPKKKVRWALP